MRSGQIAQKSGNHPRDAFGSDGVLRQILIRAKNGLNLATFKYVGTTDDFNPEPLPGKANRSSVAEAHR